MREAKRLGEGLNDAIDVRKATYYVGLEVVQARDGDQVCAMKEKHTRCLSGPRE